MEQTQPRFAVLDGKAMLPDRHVVAGRWSEALRGDYLIRRRTQHDLAIERREARQIGKGRFRSNLIATLQFDRVSALHRSPASVAEPCDQTIRARRQPRGNGELNLRPAVGIE